jgi:regulator of ribonuclease activity A
MNAVYPPSAQPSANTCDLGDQHKTDTSGAFRALPPVFKNFGGKARFAGPISTVRCLDDNSVVKAALEERGAGRVLVVDGGASLRRALVGLFTGGRATDAMVEEAAAAVEVGKALASVAEPRPEPVVAEAAP